jgi:hypothetical protein
MIVEPFPERMRSQTRKMFCYVAAYYDLLLINNAGQSGFIVAQADKEPS